MPNLIRPPDKKDSTTFLRMLFLRTEQRLIAEINRKRHQGYVDYAEVAALNRVQQILRDMVDECWLYVPKMIETIFYRSEAAANGYRNAAGLTATQLNIVEQLSSNLLGDITDAAETAEKHIETVFQIGRLEEGRLREEALKEVAQQQAAGYGSGKAAKELSRKLQEHDLTAFIDKAGRKWSLQDYCNMVTRTTARQAEISAILTADPGHDLYQIVRIGSTCPVCAPLEGRVYSRSGIDPDYPALAKAFGKIDPAGGDDLSNTYLNIHPNCLHALIKYTTIGKTDKQIQKDKDFSSFEKNPVTVDPRTKKQIAAYREKVRNRQRLLADRKQHEEYRRILGDDIPKDFEKFRDMKYNEGEKFSFMKLDYQRRNKLIQHPELRLPNAEKAILPEGKFTKYLFGGTNADGIPKGKAFESRLGYDLQNWKELQKEIRKKAEMYPAVFKGNVGFGDKYEQQIVLNGLKGTPANVIVGWISKPDGKTSMTSAYIKEVKK